MAEHCSYNLHGLIRLRLDGVSAEVAAFIAQRLSQFRELSDVSDGAEQLVEVLPSDGFDWPLLGQDHLGAERGGFTVEWQGHPAVLSLYRQQPDMLLQLTPPFRLHYLPRPGNVGRLYGLLLFLVHRALMSCGARLVHGAAASRNGETVVLSGPRGSRKSLLLLSMLRDGWDLLADDKFILHSGRVLNFEEQLVIEPHHLQALPWLLDCQPELKKLTGGKFLQFLADSCERRLPSYLLPRVRRLYQRSWRMNPAELFPNALTLAEGPLTKLVLLSSGGRQRRALSSTQAGVLFEQVQSLLFAFLGALPAQVELALPQPFNGSFAQAADSFSSVDCLLLGAPPFAAVEQIYQELLQCVEPV